MFSVATLFTRRIECFLKGHKTSHKNNSKINFGSINIQRIARVHPALFYLCAYIGLPLSIMGTVFIVVYAAFAPLSFIMGWM